VSFPAGEPARPPLPESQCPGQASPGAPREVFDVAVDLRRSSPTFENGTGWCSPLNANNSSMSLRGSRMDLRCCRKAPCSTTNGEFYSQNAELAIRWDDPPSASTGQCSVLTRTRTPAPDLLRSPATGYFHELPNILSSERTARSAGNCAGHWPPGASDGHRLPGRRSRQPDSMREWVHKSRPEIVSMLPPTPRSIGRVGTRPRHAHQWHRSGALLKLPNRLER
jgi:hypothetical protein